MLAAAPLEHFAADHLLFSSLRNSEIPDAPLDKYDAVVVGLTLRHILYEATGKSLCAADMAFTRVSDEAAATELIEAGAAAMRQQLAALHEKLSGKPTFFLTFLHPSFNYIGNLLGRYDRTSPVNIVSSLNAELHKAAAELTNFHTIELNDIINWIGRAHLQDDIVNTASHASLIGDNSEFDRERLVPPENLLERYDAENHSRAFGWAIWRVLRENLQILAQAEPVKLIIVDLDDTLWRGVAADDSMPQWQRVEGWPLGFLEALLFFRKRGGMLAICSKNDETATLARLAAIFQGAVSPADFVSIKINWSAKGENIQYILREVNILPRNALFIDDNPRELDEVSSAIAELRCCRASHYDWRSLILRSPEFQAPAITRESQTRTETTRALVERERQAETMPRADWLRSLGVKVALEYVLTPDGAASRRAFELINKTNQFNTTGRRRTAEEFSSFFAGDGVCVLASLRDRTIDNGIIGAVLVRAGVIEQAVLSCRVFGLGAEIVMGAAATRLAISQAGRAIASLIDTGRNFTCHKYFETLGFVAVDGGFQAEKTCDNPGWIEVEDAAAPEPR
jgi:FkbH-like protein